MLVGSLNPELQEIERIESAWSLERLLALRRAIFEHFINKPAYRSHLIKLKLEYKNNLATNKNKNNSKASSYLNAYGYLPWPLASFKDYYFKQQTETVADEAQNDSNNEQQQPNTIDDEVMALINDTLENDTLFKRDSLFANIELKLPKASILLLVSSSSASESHRSPLVELKLEDSLLQIDAMPRHESFLVECNLGSFFVYDRSRITQSVFPALVYPKSSVVTSGSISTTATTTSDGPPFSVFNLTYEHKPLNRLFRTTSNLKIKSCGLDVVFNRQIVERILRAGEELTRVVKRCTRDVKFELNNNNNEETAIATTMTAAGRPNTINSTLHDINFVFEITGPKVILPHEYYSTNPYVFVFDFGQLTLINRNWAASLNESVLGRKGERTANGVNVLKEMNERNQENPDNLSGSN